MSEVKTNLPQVRVDDPTLQKVLDQVTLTLRTWNGETKNDLERVITYRDLVEDTAIATQFNQANAAGSSGGIQVGAPVDLTVPVTLSNLVASAGLANVILTWDGANLGNYSYTEVWRHTSDDLGNATLLGTSIAPVYADSVGDTSNLYYYWVRAVSTGDIAGAFNATAGVSATTNAVLQGNFAAGIEPVAVESTLPNPVGYTGPNTVFLTTDNKLYRYDSVTPAWTTVVKEADIDSAAITETKIGPNAVTTGKINTNAVTANEIAATTITSTEMAANSIIAGKIAAGAINAANIFATGIINAAAIGAGEVTADKITATTLAAINANLGAITAGSLSINNKFIVDSSGNTTIRSATTGARVEIKNNVIKVYDSTNTVRVQIGDLTA